MKSFAVIPAAGRSRRMGCNKLLLQWEGKPLISHSLAIWRAAGIDVTVVVRKDDEELAAVCRLNGAIVIQPEVDPADMKASVAYGLEKIRQEFGPNAEDYWLLAPADMPCLHVDVVQEVVSACQRHPGSIVTPTWRGRRGHPSAFPWFLANAVSQLPADQGVKVLLLRCPVLELEVEHSDVLTDVDTPEDYQQLTRRPQKP